MVITPLSPKGEKIVIIESSESFGKKLSDTFKADNYSNVFLFKNGEQGLKGIYDVLPHFIILDIALSDTDGYQILAKKQAEPLLSKIPVLLLSTGAVINMHSIPPDSVTQIIIAPPTKSIEILKNVNDFFGYPTVEPILEMKTSSVVKKKLLWVEDDKLIGNILSKKLIASGFDLVHANSGEEAMKSLESRMPDAIIVDLLLPTMSGFDILQKVKDNDILKKVPRMVLSNLSKTSDIDKAKSLGVTKFLVKASTSLDQIVAEIRDLCK